MDINLDFLRSCSFFSDFEDGELSQILGKIQKQEVSENEVLFHENEPGDSLYILVKGKLAVFTNNKHMERFIGYVRPGEVVGELSIFSNEPRSASVRAAFQSTVIQLRRDDFQEICLKNPKMLWKTTTLIADRSQSNIEYIRTQKRRRPQIVGIITIGQMEADELMAQFKANSKYKINFVDYEAAKKDKSLLYKAADHGFEAIYFLDVAELKADDEIVKLSDKIILAVDADQNDASSLKKLWDGELQNKTRSLEKELLLLHGEVRTWYPKTIEYLEIDAFSRHYHVCYRSSVTVRRVLRFLCGKSVGVVLSGGGAKGWALGGALFALGELDVEIDYVGGTSIGSMACATVVMGKDRHQTRLMARKYGETVGASLFALKNLTWPVCSLFNGKQETKAIKEICEEVMIEDLTLPFFAISANLSAYAAHVWDKGLLWKACRASMSVPSVIPPLVHEGQIHVDGGILNNFPVNVMREKLNDEGIIIGVNISKSAPDPHRYDLPPEMGIWDAIRIKMRNKNSISLLEMMERVLMITSVQGTKENEKKCDILIVPNLDQFSFTDFSKVEELFEIGYQETCEAVKNFKNILE